MEVDEIQRQVTKFQRVSSNGSTTTTENSSNPQKIATRIGNFEIDDNGGGGGGSGGGDHVVVGGTGGLTRLCGWPSSRIVRVSRASGGKDRHSKVLTSKGLRDRRVRLSVGTAIQFYDLQDRLGYDQPSKAVEWLLKAAASSIDELPSLDLPIAGAITNHPNYNHMRSPKKLIVNGNDNDNDNSNNGPQTKSPVCSSTSETSKGSELSLARSENRIKARERAREMASKREKEKEKEIDSTRVNVNMLNQVNHIPDNSSFTDLLTGSRSPVEYFFNRQQQTPHHQLFQLPQFNITTTTGDNNNNLHHFSFLQQQDNLNFPMASPSSSVAPGGFTRGTLQSNLPSSILPHHHHHLQRFQQSAMDGSASTNLPFFVVPNNTVDHFPATGGYQLSYGGGGDHQRDKAKN